ncbi:MAG: response regulator [Clostridia bacterium]|nr:response regulator [Clostridia bacterium]
MIQVAICDDIPEEIKKLKVHINRYANENQMQISVSGFSSADDIISALDNSAMYDVIFLDIYMDVLNGIDLADKISRIARVLLL